MRPDRVMIGTDSDAAKSVMHSLYRPLSLIETPILFTNRETAELIVRHERVPCDKDQFFQVIESCEGRRASGTFPRGWDWTARSGAVFASGPGYGGVFFEDTLRWSDGAERRYPYCRSGCGYQHNRKKAMASRIIYACGGDVSGKTIAISG